MCYFFGFVVRIGRWIEYVDPYWLLNVKAYFGNRGLRDFEADVMWSVALRRPKASPGSAYIEDEERRFGPINDSEGDGVNG